MKFLPCSASVPLSTIPSPPRHPSPQHPRHEGAPLPVSARPPRRPQRSAAARGVCGAPRRQPAVPPRGSVLLLPIKKTFSFPPFLPSGPEPEGGEGLKERQGECWAEGEELDCLARLPARRAAPEGSGLPQPVRSRSPAKEKRLVRTTGPRGKRLEAPGRKRRGASLPQSHPSRGWGTAAHLRRGQGGGEGGYCPWGAGREVSPWPQPMIANKARGCA